MAVPAHQFEDVEQQRQAVTLGIWIFLATEVLFFGAVLLGYTVYRLEYSSAFGEASRHLDIVLGTVNTGVLLCSSLTMALGVREAERGRRGALARYLMVTILLGLVFLTIKFLEYYHKFKEGLVPGSSFVWHGADPGHAGVFFLFYFILTGIHALHMIIGVLVLAGLTAMSYSGRLSSSYYAPVDAAGLYWHFVDIVWVFLFPLLYLVDRGS
jgi:cytochrome c oxidase subunit 3